MSDLLVVRHAQASMFADDYDQLSKLGIQQAKQLGAAWATAGSSLEAVYSGPRQRHLETAKIVREVYESRGLSFPEITVIQELDEHQIDLATLQLLDEPSAIPELTPLITAYQSRSSTDHERARDFQRLFETVAEKWCLGTPLLNNIESWSDFRARVRDAIRHIRERQSNGRRVAVFTSVGPISVFFQVATQCSDSVALQTGWRVRNTSLSKFLFSGNRFTVDLFNSTAHLPSDWVTYR